MNKFPLYAYSILLLIIAILCEYVFQDQQGFRTYFVGAVVLVAIAQAAPKEDKK